MLVSSRSKLRRVYDLRESATVQSQLLQFIVIFGSLVDAVSAHSEQCGHALGMLDRGFDVQADHVLWLADLVASTLPALFLRNGGCYQQVYYVCKWLSWVRECEDSKQVGRCVLPMAFVE